MEINLTPRNYKPADFFPASGASRLRQKALRIEMKAGNLERDKRAQQYTPPDVLKGGVGVIGKDGPFLINCLKSGKGNKNTPNDHRTKNFFFIPLVHWTSKIQILVVRKLISLVQKNY